MSTGSGGTAGQGATAKECAETISAKQLIGVGFADVTNARRWLGFPEPVSYTHLRAHETLS